MTILAFLGILTILVLVHELGHFSIAKLFKVKIIEFGLGYPPRLFSFTFKETVYSLNSLPLGGFVRMLGEEESSEQGSFSRKSPWQRLAILSAGSAMNLLLPIFLFWGAFIIPHSVHETKVVILEVAANSPAEKAGLAKGDIVSTVEGDTIFNSNDLLNLIQSNLNASSDWVIERNDSLKEIYIPEIRENPPEGEGSIGIKIGNGRVYLENVPPGSSLEALGFRSGDLILQINGVRVFDSGEFYELMEGTTEPYEILLLRGTTLKKIPITDPLISIEEISTSTLGSIKRSNNIFKATEMSIEQLISIFSLIGREVSSLLKGTTQLQLAGPVGIAKITGDVAKSGINSLLLWAGILSINLGILNLLPIPALDGGRIVFVLFELVSGGKRLSPQHEKLIHVVGFFSLIGLIFMITVNDIQQIIGPA